MVCSKCGSKISNDSKFCSKCGNKTVSQYNNKPQLNTQICNRCGSKISDNSKFCSKCGNNTSNVGFDEVKNNEVKNKQIKNNQIKNNEVQNNEVQNNEVQNNEVQNNEVQNNEVQNNEVQNNEVQNNEVQNNEVNGNAEKNNIQTDYFSKVKNTNQNIERQFKVNKKPSSHRFMWACGVAVIMLIAKIAGSSLIGVVVIMIVAELARAYYLSISRGNKNTNTNQKTNSDDYGLSEEEALRVAQEFVDTHPLLRCTVTGDIQYELQAPMCSTKGLYYVELKTDNGSNRGMWVDKRTGYVFFIAKYGQPPRDAEEVYQEIFVSKQGNDEILLNGRNVSDYLGNDTINIYDSFGPDKYGTDVGGSLYDNCKHIGYEGISFLYNDLSNIQRICGKPELFTYNDVTLNKNRDELAEMFGTPVVEDSLYNNATGTSNYWVEYNKDNYTIKFEFSSLNADAYLIQIYKQNDN